MRDQAADLRRMSAETAFRTDPGQTGAAVFVVGSGKGGVGKSVLSITLAAALVRENEIRRMRQLYESVIYRLLKHLKS